MGDAVDRAAFSQAARAGRTVWTAGVYDALSAQLAQAAGFPAVMTSGFAVSASLLGQPDVEVYTMTENVGVARNVANAVRIPVIADADTGYGNAINVMRTVREFEQAGVAALIFEDQEVPKRCPAVAARIEILPVAESAAKIRAAVEARRDPNLLIVARTDATTEDEAIERAQAYVKAGADLIQPISRCFTSIEGLRRLREACGRPLSLQILGWLETDLAKEEIEEIAGLAVFPLVGLLTVSAALQQNFAALRRTHSARALPLPTTTMADFKKFIGFAEVEALQSRFLLGDLYQK
jgi:2-methylisocitrate lyase-like PEP mutase family enzyme